MHCVCAALGGGADRMGNRNASCVHELGTRHLDLHMYIGVTFCLRVPLYIYRDTRIYMYIGIAMHVGDPYI